jgi:dTDP-4-amino-4,6-dideoxygalactose transaminase
LNLLPKKRKPYLNDQLTRITCSGTAALYIILQAIKNLKPSGQYIIIPSYICPLVPLAIHRAGFKVLVCELEESQTSFNYNQEKLQALCQNQGAETEIAAVIACHLAGVPLDMNSIEACTQGKNIFIIEDAAQALGASFQNQKSVKSVGTRGDFAFFSLCRGKGPSMFEGGILTSKHKNFEQIIDAKIAEHIPPQNLTLIELRRIIELLGYALFYRPLFMWFVFKAPQLYWENVGAMRLEKTLI